MATETLTPSSSPHRFQQHVGFDNITSNEPPTKDNPISLTLNYRHNGYQKTRSSRTFMVGVDDNSYSDHALQWLLDELVDDGDEIVCVRVIETQVRSSDKSYHDAASQLQKHIQSKNVKNLAIALVVEYAVGKLHNTFQSFIKIHEPSMLIVGTKGRSLDSVQGFFSSYNSFSKYCLQYSPVPVVVVRPNEKREKKKAKRAQDPGPTTTALTNSNPPSTPTKKPIVSRWRSGCLPHSIRRSNLLTSTQYWLGGGKRAATPTREPASMLDLAERGQEPLAPVNKEGDPVPDPSPDSDGEDSEYEEVFDVTSGADEAEKKERLHKMESNEGAALKTSGRKMSTESIDDEDEGGAKTGNG
ncbi:hypothetical protein PG997_002296 [Apiospora hydei]|uniref:UspA domain-containing protein n=1 Tax=Apiospora hydei TaxID=1337664 RepID=A0ABR1X932_9PEZI